MYVYNIHKYLQAFTSKIYPVDVCILHILMHACIYNAFNSANLFLIKLTLECQIDLGMYY